MRRKRRSSLETPLYTHRITLQGTVIEVVDELKYQAHRLMWIAIKAKKLFIHRCEVCNKSPDETKIHGHHEDYTKPLEVNWLCAYHHHLVHN